MNNLEILKEERAHKYTDEAQHILPGGGNVPRPEEEIDVRRREDEILHRHIHAGVHLTNELFPPA